MAMTCPLCQQIELRAVMTEQGIEIDCCLQCNGIWLDKGEIYLLSKDSSAIKEEIEYGLRKGMPSQYTSPKTHEAMIKIPLFNGTSSIHYCPETHGVWLAKAELQKMVGNKNFSLNIDMNSYNYAKRLETGEEEKTPQLAGQMQQLPLPNLALRSSTVILALYALLGVILIALVEFTGMSLNAAFMIGVSIAAGQFLFGPYIMDLSLSWFYKMKWINLSELPEHLQNFISNLCRDNHMNSPRMGVIHDGAPNAFTYGHHPNNARLVITQGILDLLDEREVEAVIAHEIGHARHWDMLIMTVAQIAPLILYYMYRTILNLKIGKNDKAGDYRFLAATGAYILYIVSEYIVLWLSRTREYHADRFAGEAVGNPNFLASALVKIGYGLAGQEPAGEKAEEKPRHRNVKLEAVGALGIFDTHTARSLAVTGYAHGNPSGGREVNRKNLVGAMKWDLWNPWAKYYELHSTHPLIANRLRYLSHQAAFAGLDPYVTFQEVKPESYWNEFMIDLSVAFTPLIIGVIFGIMYLKNPGSSFISSGLFALGLGLMIKTLFSYRNDHFPELNIASLLKRVKVSSVRPVPCTLKGRIIGRGMPGLIWSEDFVLQDDTGIIFLDYKQPLRLWEFLFAILRRESLQNEEVTITGWYRRSPVPYVELKTLRTEYRKRTCYVYHMKLASAVIVILVGLMMML
ncbi:MAG: M48 family metalloprotease [bacterium]